LSGCSKERLNPYQEDDYIQGRSEIPRWLSLAYHAGL
jgi:hypothetical protein